MKAFIPVMSWQQYRDFLKCFSGYNHDQATAKAKEEYKSQRGCYPEQDVPKNEALWATSLLETKVKL